MAFYNGYSEAERNKAGHWQYRAVSEARWPSQPPSCVSCGQTEGKIIRHLEDYTLPQRFEEFAAEDKSIALCYRCHGQVHNRLKRPEKWDAYRTDIRAGWRYAPAGSKVFGEQISCGVRRLKTQYKAPARFVLDEIHDGRLCPQGRLPGNSNGPTPIHTEKEKKWRSRQRFIERMSDWTEDNITIEYRDSSTNSAEETTSR